MHSLLLASVCIKMNSHEKYRKMLCAICMGKTKQLRKISLQMSQDIEEFFIPNFNLSNSMFPTSICDACRKQILKRKTNLLQCHIKFLTTIMLNALSHLSEVKIVCVTFAQMHSVQISS